MRSPWRHPARIVPFAFLALIAAGTALMMLPAARAEPGHAPFVTALFTAASAVCVAGMAVVDTPGYWSPFGHVLLTVLTQIGGFGIMALATLLSLLVSRRLGLRGRLLAQAESAGLSGGNTARVLIRVALVMLVAESLIAVVLTLRFWLAYDYSFGRAVWEAVFHAVQAFNNAGFALYSDSLVQFVTDPWICLSLGMGVMAGSIGFPVLFELAREWRTPGSWSTHTFLTVTGSLLLTVVGFLVFLVFEWRNPGTLGPLSTPGKILAAFTQDVMTRSGGFNSVDLGRLNSETIAVTNGLMFIGGGSASTAGGIKLTTFMLLGYVIWAEIRGEPDVVIRKRRIAEETQRQAVTVALIGVALVATGTVVLDALTENVPFDRALFEVTSAFATVGLSTGITPSLPPSAQVVLVVLMYVGRVGTIAVGTAIALNTRRRHYRYPEERPSLADQKLPEGSHVAVIGLGRFGGAVAETLLELGYEVLGIDSDARIVQSWSDRLTQVAEADATDEEALRQLGVHEFGRAVVAIGTNLETSVLTVLTLTEIGVPEIWAKATSVKHGKILASVGADHVVFPETEMGERVGHLISGRMLDYIEFDDGFAIAKVRAPRGAAGRTLADLGLRTKWGVTVVGTKRPGEDFVYARPETVVPQNAVLIVAGDTAKVEAYAAEN